METPKKMVDFPSSLPTHPPFAKNNTVANWWAFIQAHQRILRVQKYFLRNTGIHRLHCLNLTFCRRKTKCPPRLRYKELRFRFIFGILRDANNKVNRDLVKVTWEDVMDGMWIASLVVDIGLLSHTWWCRFFSLRVCFLFAAISKSMTKSQLHHQTNMFRATMFGAEFSNQQKTTDFTMPKGWLQVHPASPKMATRFL